MRPITLAVIVIVAGIAYGSYRGHQAKVAKEQRAAFVRDSIKRVDSLAYEAIRASMNQQAAAQLGAQQGRAVLSAAQAGNAAGAAAIKR